MKKIVFLLGFLWTGYGISAQVNTYTPEQNRLQNKLRIKEGKKNGSLTKKEIKKLNRQQRRVNKTERKAKADGIVTLREQKKIARQNQKLSHAIYRKKHNRITVK